MFWYIFGIATCIKLLFIPAYRSTDFEVHRNWLAITHNLPVGRWYYENTSEWTLDYPPFFAWFEYFLGRAAVFFDQEMLKVENLNYASFRTVLFQRLSVIAADLVFAYGVKECSSYLSTSGVRKSSKWSSKWGSPTIVLQILLFGNAGLLLIDHIHFQYNGFLFGIFLLSISKILQGKHLQSAVYFTVLLNLKHLFLYVAPTYFVYLLRNYCFTNSNRGFSVDLSSFSKNRFLKLSFAVTSIFLLSFGPFAFSADGIRQIFDRLFPFGRGLCHAYWAPNFWALYNGLDKLLETGGRVLNYQGFGNGTSTKGLIGHLDHAILPNVGPKTTLFLTAASIVPCCAKLWRCPGNPLHFVRCLVVCGLSGFIFGWHVHEKAILTAVIPLCLTAVIWKKEARIFVLLSVAGYYSLHPLLFTAFEVPLKYLIILIHCVYSFNNLSCLFYERHDQEIKLPVLNAVESAYVLGFFLLFLLDTVFFPFLGVHEKLPFLGLLLTSCYCSLGVLYCWIKYYWHFVTMSEFDHKRKTH